LALIADRGEKLVQQIPVRGVNFDNAETSLAGAACRRREGAGYGPNPSSVRAFGTA